MVEHKQIRISHPAFEEAVDVDEGIALLLVALWDRGIMTCNSCQENPPGTAWVEFYSVTDAEKFVSMLISGLDPVGRPEEDDFLYSRILGWSGNERGSWKYEVHTQDCREYYNSSKDVVELDTSLPCSIEFTVSMRFPVEDYTRVLDLVSRSASPLGQSYGLCSQAGPADPATKGCRNYLAGNDHRFSPSGLG